MSSVLVIADSGPELSRLTTAVGAVPGAYLVRHGSSAAPLDGLLRALAPDLVLIGRLAAPADAPLRVAEVRRAAPAALIVVLRPEGGAFDLGAAVVLPAALEPAELADALATVLAAPAVLGAAA